MSSTISIKVPTDSPVAKIVSIVRKIDTIPISEITRRIKNNDYLLVYSCTDNKGLSTLIKCYNEFIKLGITPSLYEHDRPTNIEFFNNLHNSYNDTEAFIDALVEAEDAAECGDDEE